jgi:type II secretory pathway component PulM
VRLAALDRLRQWHDGLGERDQRVLRWGAAGALAILLVGGLWQAQSAVAGTRDAVERKRLDLAFMQAASAEIIAAGPSRAPASGEPLLVIVDRAARESGLAGAIGASEPVAPDGLRIRFGAASFDALVAMTARLAQQYGIGVAAASVERGTEPGAVNATLTFRSAAAR